MSLKVCMFVYNNFLHDSRVLKEARSLVASGYTVTVVALLDDTTKSFEVLDDIKIVRVKNGKVFRLLQLPGKFNIFIKKIFLKDAIAVRHAGVKKIFKLLRILFSLPFLFLYHIGKRLFAKAVRFLIYNIGSYQFVAANPVDICHANDLSTLPIAWYCARKHNAHLVYDSHELYVEKKQVKTFQSHT